MERLAKEKIAKQERLKFLRHQVSTRFDNMHSTIQLPDGEGSNGIRERGTETNYYVILSEQNISISPLNIYNLIISSSNEQCHRSH